MSNIFKIPQIEPNFDHKESKALSEYMNSGGWITEFKKTIEFEDAINRLLRFVDARRYVVLRQLKVAEKGNSWRERQHFGFHSFLYSSRHDW